MRILTIVIALFLACGPAAAQVIVPVTGAVGGLVPVTINTSPGDQYDPHVSGDWVVYTSDIEIRYYNLVTGVDAAIPLGTAQRDLLSDVSGSKIVFSRIITSVKTALMVFDAAAPGVAPLELDAVPGTTIRIGSAIGSNTVAYIDFGLHGNGELVVHDLTTSASVRITNDTAFDANPSVSPDGNVVTWEHCPASTSNCDIWQSVKSGAIWTVSVVTDTTNPEANSDSNGTLVVYDSVRSGNGDVFWRTAIGGVETQLQLPGVEANPSISGNLISFESRPTLFATSDIYIYDISTNLLYRINDTSASTEQLNDITVLTDGRIGVVWTSDEDGFDARNVRAATFSLATVTPCQGTSTPSILGSFIPRAPEATLTQGGAPNYADTFVTPYLATQAGTITSWKAEFAGGHLITGGIGVPSGIQLKVLRYTTENILEVVAAGAVHDPRPILQARFGGYPLFNELDAVIEFTDIGLSVQPGDVIGLTIKSDPAVGGYFYPLVSPSGTKLVQRNEEVGGTIDLMGTFTSTLGWTPALQVNVNSCSSFNFLGFFQPVDNLPAVNVVTAGQAIPVKFSLDGDQGLDIFAAGHPVSNQVVCNSNEPVDVIEETVTAGGSSLSYDASIDQYTYVWKTQKAWKGSCRLLNVRLSDGSNHYAKFRFR